MNSTPNTESAGPESDVADAALAEVPVDPGTTAIAPPQMLVGSRNNLALTLLAVFGAVLMLQWASAVFVPLMLGLTLSYALNPAVTRLQRLHLPRAAGAALVLATLERFSEYQELRVQAAIQSGGITGDTLGQTIAVELHRPLGGRIALIVILDEAAVAGDPGQSQQA